MESLCWTYNQNIREKGGTQRIETHGNFLQRWSLSQSLCPKSQTWAVSLVHRYSRAARQAGVFTWYHSKDEANVLIIFNGWLKLYRGLSWHLFSALLGWHRKSNVSALWVELVIKLYYRVCTCLVRVWTCWGGGGYFKVPRLFLSFLDHLVKGLTWSRYREASVILSVHCSQE